ncbi:thermonuclease family protein [Candidatus Manganitrophus noduliformans]|uniref:Thermonuclease family protein n=1 Tax=Candidatus Manganitrophus noduliformans TaxID=2606439 RepID=A0A7X6DN42_9BACT|nr:thermonuclease family protein [Candidatus Manganitrophus noduliformans]NKE70185.1 thermonuclease family protein [Candidatus Manganitrophus noduliformans]
MGWRLNCIAIAVYLFIPTVVLAESFSGKVVKVSDGDTISVMHQGRAQKVRLHGIDAPEKRQAFGNRAKKFTSDLAFGRVVTVQAVDVDRYGRIVGEVILPDGRSLNRKLVKAGLAWWYRKYSKDKSLGELEEEARSARRGLWIDPNPIPPWEFRKKEKVGSR